MPYEDNKLINHLDSLVSESRNPSSFNLDQMTSSQIVELMNREDAQVPLAIAKCHKEIAAAIDCITDVLSLGGRLIYIGAGSSGRLGILDAVECPPTFSTDPGKILGIIAGGNQAIFKAVEGAEDDIEQGKQDLRNINFLSNDILVGIAASGRTPYVLGALDFASKLGAKTIGISCNPNSEIASRCEINICTDVGPEILTGSTRLKSATAQKQILNMLTTASMVRSGKVYQNLMVDVKASNKKLRARAIKIVMQATNSSREVSEKALLQSETSVKQAILQILAGVSPKKAKDALNLNNGFLRISIKSLRGE